MRPEAVARLESAIALFYLFSAFGEPVTFDLPKKRDIVRIEDPLR